MSNKDTRHCLWAEILPSRGAQRQDTPRRGRLTYGAGLPGLAEQFLCCALMSGHLTLHAGMCSAVGLTVLQNASACMLMYAHLCCPPSPEGQVQLAVVPHRSSFRPLCTFSIQRKRWWSDPSGASPPRPLCLDPVCLNPDISNIVSLSSSPF